MTMPGPKYNIQESQLGTGGYSRVFPGTDIESGQAVALKKSRCSLIIKKPHLRHESRILQLLQSPGHPAIPAIYGYVHLPHFEYMAMELLGPSVANLQPDGTRIAPKTVVSVVLQTISALEYVHKMGIMHRDVKQANLMCALDDPSRIKLIDFGLSRMFYKSELEPRRSESDTATEEPPRIIGTLELASLNAHNGLPLSARDDLESLAYVALNLLRGDLPWSNRPWLEPENFAQEAIFVSKRNHTAECLGAGFPPEFAHLLTYSRSLRFNQLPDYDRLTAQFTALGQRLGLRPGALDWTPQPGSRAPRKIKRYSGPDEEWVDDGKPRRTPSYMAPDYENWDTQGTECEEDLTLPKDVEERMDCLIPIIEDVQPRWF